MGGKNQCDYDSSSIKMDRRFVRCRRDAFVTLLSYLGTIIAMWVIGYALSPDDVSEITYFLGFPLWYTVCTLICFGYAVFAIIWAINTRKFSLEARGDDEEVDA